MEWSGDSFRMPPGYVVEARYNLLGQWTQNLDRLKKSGRNSIFIVVEKKCDRKKFDSKKLRNTFFQTPKNTVFDSYSTLFFARRICAPAVRSEVVIY